MRILILLFFCISYSFSQSSPKYEVAPLEDESHEYEIAVDTRTEIDKLSDPDKIVRKNALISIGTKRDKKYINHIVKMLNDKDIEIRTIAVNLLSEMGTAQTVGANILEVFKQDKDNTNFQMACIIALGKLKYKPAIPYIKEKLNHIHPVVRTYAISSLGEFKDPTVYPLIKEKISDPAEGVSIEAMRVSAKCGIKTAIPIIKEKLKHPVASVRREAVLALGELADKTIIPDLESLLDDEDKSVVDAVKKVIEKFEGKPKK